MAPSDPRESRISELLGDRYELIELLGRGGFAAVYRVRNRRLDRAEALKVLSETLLEDPDFAKRFEQEARVAASLDHPNIVKVYDYGALEGIVWYSMQFIGGPSVGREIKRLTRFDQTAAARIAGDVLDALRYSHDRGVVHRDIKPDNILLDAEERPYLADFGIAKSAAGLVQTRTGMLLGSPAYMAPEQIQGQPLDGRADIYSLGVTLYRMLAGSLPFQGDDTLRATLKRLTEAPEPLSIKRPDIDPRLETIVMKALARHREERYASAREMREDLQALLAAPPVSGAPSRPVANAASETDPTRRVAAPTKTQAATAAPVEKTDLPAPTLVEAATAAAGPARAAGRVSSARRWVFALGAVALAVAAALWAMARARETRGSPAALPRAPTPSSSTLPSQSATAPPAVAATALPAVVAPTIAPPPSPEPARAASTAAPTPAPRAARRPPPAREPATQAGAPSSASVPEARFPSVRPEIEEKAPLQLAPGVAAEHGDEFVGLAVTVGEDGTVRSARVISPVCPECDRAALEAVRRYRFRPARDSAGRPVEATVAISIRLGQMQ